MTASAYIARILGPILVIIGLGLLLEGEMFRAMAGEFLKSAALIYFSGLITLAVGLAILNVHHVWTRDWRSVITVFGWLAVIGGIFRILAPTLVQRMGDSLFAHQRWPIMGAIMTLALGAFLSVMGYQDIWQGKRRVHHRTSAVKSSGAASRSAKRPRRKSGEGRQAR
jgi:positive regulator of sigma E activity